MMPGEVKLRRPWAIGLLALAARVEAANMRDAQARGTPEEAAKRKTIVDDYEGAIAELMAERKPDEGQKSEPKKQPLQQGAESGSCGAGSATPRA